jgi:hypothetical protein
MVGNSTLAKQAIRVMDLHTLDPIAKSPLINNFQNGSYFLLRYTGGVRLRIMTIDGSNTASAVFVSPVTPVPPKGSSQH